MFAYIFFTYILDLLCNIITPIYAHQVKTIRLIQQSSNKFCFHKLIIFVLFLFRQVFIQLYCFND